MFEDFSLDIELPLSIRHDEDAPVVLIPWMKNGWLNLRLYSTGDNITYNLLWKPRDKLVTFWKCSSSQRQFECLYVSLIFFVSSELD